LKFCIIVGTRPQIIKSQPIINELISRKKDFTIVHTGQHYDYEMSRTFFQELKIDKPDYNLRINRGSASSQLAQIIKKLEIVLTKIKPNIVIIPGDTRSALGAALSATRVGIPLAHLEAGARSYDNKMEEEVNRRLIDHCSDLLFAPTKNCLKNLHAEAVLGRAYFTGDTMYDVFLEYQKILKLKSHSKEKFVLMTIHRRDNIEDYHKMKKIIELAKTISKLGYKVIFPIHPHTKKQISSFKLSLKDIHSISPVKYSEMLKLLSKAKLLLTDSGGLQKEAFWSNTTCITLRKNTEWIETLDKNHNMLLGTIKKSDLSKISRILNSRKHKKKPQSMRLFGNGNASKKIVSILLKQF